MTNTLLAYASQGHGDAMQMARYLPALAARCAKLIVMVHGSLVKLFERQARGRWRVMALDAETPEHDAYVDMMSLPYLLGTDHVSKIPAPADFHTERAHVRVLEEEAQPARGYGREHLATADRITGPRDAGAVATGSGRALRRQVAPNDERGDRAAADSHRLRLARVALCTQGGKVASLDLDRSDHAGSLATLKDMPGVEWVDFTGRTGDWLDTARELATCDLLISVDSALAHLAGSLGVETWLIPPTHFEWRWPCDPWPSPWYPATHTLYRRANTRDWPGVTARIRNDLERRGNG